MSIQTEVKKSNIVHNTLGSLPKGFDIKVNDDLLRQVIIGTASNNHRSTSQTKTRADVRGGGRKPWKQKGTGRARQGSSRAPHWIGGGITFGPSTQINFSHILSQKLRKSALQMLIKRADEAKKLIIVESIPSCLKTKDATMWLATLPIKTGQGMVLDSLSSSYTRGFANIPYVRFQSLQSPRIDYIAESEWIIATQRAIDTICTHNTKKSKSIVKKIKDGARRELTRKKVDA